VTALSKQGALLSVVLAACMWGCWSLVLRPTGLSGAVTAPILLAGIAVTSAPMALRELRANRVRWTQPIVLAIVLYGVADAVNVGTFFRAMVTTSVAVAVLTHSVAPVLVALLSPAIEGTKSRRAPIAALMAISGLVLVLEPWRGTDVDASLVLGAGLGLASAVGYATTVFAARRLTDSIGPATALCSHSVLAVLLLAPLAVGELPSIEPSDAGYLMIAILLPGTLAGVLFLRALPVIGSARAAVLALIEPLVACLVGWAAFGERLGPLGALGGALVLFAVAYVATEDAPIASTQPA